ncbi:DUF4838 domain-containing protein [Carboxylicivirga sediminis]|uniref:DUF4838 domain-containing protein n=1 Tax=Carboxylicivirga sediminis TaxID=2006564 RepID=A0A941IX55_9BACT|nr:DUF4838 domain-containing protein [Carboxylicivirga sediminis]MBR8535710.1 DUF4838 domain-containing protein [Carboxylicivirga sediminis]
MKQSLFLLLLMIGCYSCQQSSITITKNGRSDYHIEIAADASVNEKEAAKVLQQYIQLSTGVELEVKTGYSDDKKTIQLIVNEQPEPAVRYYNKAHKLVIEGSNGYLLSAVYEFLEREMACRFWAPDAETIPQIDKLTLPVGESYLYSPPVHVRTVHSKLFYEHPEFADKQRVTYEAFPMYAPEARVHTFHRFLPADQYFDKHPEYYALVNRKRRPTQLCLSNPDVLRLVTEAVEATFASHPEASVVSVSQDDNTQYCQCEDCEAIHQEEGSPSGSMIRFVNAVAQNFPDKQISTLAYQYTRKACKTKPLDNVLITLCSIECDRSASIEDKCSDFAVDLQAWKNLTENIRIWDYTTQFTNFLAPFPNIYTLAPNIRFFADNNAKWIFEQHSHNPSELFELRSYLLARLLWNPERNTDVLIREFCDGYYGEAGPKVVEYITDIHKALESHPDFFLFLYGGPSQAFDSFLNKEALAGYNLCFDEAEAQVTDNAELLKRVRRARLGVRYATLEACRANLSETYSLKNTDFVRKELAAFEQSCYDGHITMMNETRFMVTDYLDLYERNLDRVTINNLASEKAVTLLTKPHKYANENPQTLTDNAYGGGSFYANWLGFEGNDMVAVVDLGEVQTFENISTGFLQVINHVVFFPTEVNYSVSLDGENYTKVGRILNERPLQKDSKINDTQLFALELPQTDARFVKIEAKNMKTPPVWHHAVGLPSWIFADEVQVY